MINRKCLVCAKDFYSKPSWINKGGGKYCSVQCRALAKRKGEVVRCFNCKKEVYKSLKDLKKSKSKNYFCGRECSLKWNASLHIGEDSSNWKGGKSSYKSILSREEVKKACVLCGKDYLKILSVHHLDQNRNNNNVRNLVWLCQNCHFLVHHYSTEKQKLFNIYANQEV